MFEAQVAFYLNKYLGKYLTGLDADSLRISVWRGDVELRCLALKPEALQDLELPIAVKAGLLGKLTLKVGMGEEPGGTCPSTAPGRASPRGEGWEGGSCVARWLEPKVFRCLP